MNLKAYKHILLNAVKEDLGKGDVTSNATIPRDAKVKAIIIAKEEGILAGEIFVKDLFKIIDKSVIFTTKVKDGSFVKRGDCIATISGPARSILICERTALNILSHLSGIATATNQFVSKIKNYRTKVLDTRKTMPGLRILEKYAVKTGGGTNHRIGLYDMVLIKDNHLAIISKGKTKKEAIRAAIKKAKKYTARKVKIEVEVNTLTEFETALEERPDIIMLDNMPVVEMKMAVEIRNSINKKILLEASGNVHLDNIQKIAATGVDFISIGSITDSSKAVDFSLEII